MPGTARTLQPKADELQSYGLDLTPRAAGAATGLVWAALEDGQPIPRTRLADTDRRQRDARPGHEPRHQREGQPARTRSSSSRASTTAQPVAGATVSIRDLENKVVWTRHHRRERASRVAPDTDLRDHGDDWWRVPLRRHRREGRRRRLRRQRLERRHRAVGLRRRLRPRRGRAAAARHRVRRPRRLQARRGGALQGHRCAATRRTACGCCPPGTKVEVALRDSQGDEIDKRTVALNAWSSAEWTFTLPADGAARQLRGHGDGRRASSARSSGELPGRRVPPARLPRRREPRRRDARSPASTLKGVVNGRYLFGAPMAGPRREAGRTRSAPLDTVPAKVSERFPGRPVRLPRPRTGTTSASTVRRRPLKTEEAQLDAEGQLTLDLDTDGGRGRPCDYTLEGEVTDVTRQKIAGRASFRVDPAPWYIGAASGRRTSPTRARASTPRSSPPTSTALAVAGRGGEGRR